MSQTYPGVSLFVFAISIYLSGNWNLGALGSTSLNGWDYISNSFLNKIIRVNRGWGEVFTARAETRRHVKEPFFLGRGM